MKTTPKKMALIGVFFLILSIILVLINRLVIPANAPIGKILIPILALIVLVAFPVGIALLIIGFIEMAEPEKVKEVLWPTFLGLVLIAVGGGLTWMQLKGEGTGVYIVGGVPIPLIAVTIIGAIAGIYFFIGGIVSFVKLFFK